ncbi:MAG TPA: mechanosensitive ion channel family protein, partial [Pseudorhizobium sp.]|nr:mechanosensitive ion channel family protein [Pseudorhizobium sp.]
MIRCIQLKLFPRVSLSSARSLVAAVAMSLSVLMMAAAGHAQQPPRAAVTADSINAEVQETLAASRQKLGAVRERLEQPGVDDMRLAELRVQAEDVVSEVQGTSAEMETRLAQIEARLADLGEPPAAGQPPEAAAVTEERNRLTTERAELTVLTDDAAGLTTSANQTVATISTLRRELFAQTLFKRTQLSGELFVVAGEAFVREIQELGGALGSWFSFAWKFKTLSLLASIFLSLGAALVFLSGGRRLFARLILRNASDEWPTYIKRLSLAFWSTVTRTLSLAAFLVASFLFLDGFNVLRRDIAPILAALFSFIWFVYFVSQ